MRAEIARSGSGHLVRISGGLFAAHAFAVGPVSDGMARNAALAATAALLGGVSPERIRNALTDWTPSAGRGELREAGGKFFYVDCYNASPASMTDAAACFVRRTPEDRPRLFVLGGMNELGTAAAALHREVGRKLPLRPGDALALFGGLSGEIGVGARESGFPAGAVTSHESVESLREAVAAFPGSVLLKGSRSYALERAPPARNSAATAARTAPGTPVPAGLISLSNSNGILRQSVSPGRPAGKIKCCEKGIP